MSKPPRRARTWWNSWLVARRIAMATSYRICESTAHAIHESLRVGTRSDTTSTDENAPA